MYFTSDKSNTVHQVEYLDDSYEVIKKWSVEDKFQSMNDIYKIGDWLYISSTPAALTRTKSFDDLVSGQYDDIYDQLELDGTPYYIDSFDGKYIIP